MSDASYTPSREGRPENTAAGGGWILCRDLRLARLLETELAYLGVAATVYPTLPPPSEGVCLVVADGDEFDEAPCLSLAAACACPLLIFGREERLIPAEGGVFLRRPFELSTLEKTVRHLLPDVSYPRPAVEMTVAPTSKPVPPPPPALTARDGVVTVGDHTVTLTPAEWTILEYLMAHEGQAVSREELSTLLEGGGNIVDVYVCRLRAKIEKPLGRRMIRTVRGVGYILTP